MTTTEENLKFVAVLALMLSLGAVFLMTISVTILQNRINDLQSQFPIPNTRIIYSTDNNDPCTVGVNNSGYVASVDNCKMLIQPTSL